MDELLKIAGFNELNDEYEYQISRIHPDTGISEVFAGKKEFVGLTSKPYKVSVPNGEWLLVISKKSQFQQAYSSYPGTAASIIFPLITSLLLFFLMRQPKLLSDLVDIKTKELKQLAMHDSLTGLVNRHGFEQAIKNLIASTEKNNAQHALCYMDLDQFKVINDTCGHAAGDELLRQLCQKIEETIRQTDTFARLGGDEFGILIENCALDNAYRVAESIWKMVQGYEFTWEESIFKVGISIGLVSINQETTNLEKLMSMADTACYSAKDAGRNRIHVLHSDDVQILQKHGEMQWVTRLHYALENNLFCLYAQPIVSLHGDTGKCYELLIRLKGENGNLIAPGDFLPAAERYNLMEKIDSWVIEAAFDLLETHTNFLECINHLSINLSGQSLTNSQFLDSIVTKLKISNIPGHKICFEITETAAIDNLNNAVKFITTLKSLGCTFALNDFGSGLSSYGYLKSLPVDCLKIDGMFVKDIADDPIDYAMVKSINEIGHLMKMCTIAEFVENDKVKGMLKDIGVDYAQGYGICEPMNIQDLLQSLEK